MFRMMLLFPFIESTAISLIVPPEFGCFYIVITGYITDRIFSGIDLFLLKNPKVPVLILNLRR